ncbi:MAG TPA: c-type cytochrome [Bryobacteraceae bacterium]|jgi:mono/diheme cytochrome c family protein|nr:c-type cytochrome [Bryobacteraceae bacterium]
MVGRALKIVAALVVLVIILGAGGVTYLYVRKPAQVHPSNIKVAMTPEHIARGQYIFRSISDCDSCHSQRDYTLVGAPLVMSGRGAGAILSDLMSGLPGVVVASNLTPDVETGIGSWTDGEKIRAIRDGVDRDGNALFPMMPYQAFRHMSDADVQAVVAFLDSLPPVRNPLPKTHLQFMPGLMMKSAPQPAGKVASPDRADPRHYGEYLVELGGCVDCHTPSDSHGNPLPGKTLAGGQVFATPMGTVVSANITPDRETGIGKWDADFFRKKFYDYKTYVENGSPKLSGPDAFTLMPWLGFSQKTPDDLDAIYAYLRTVAPVHNPVETHPGHPNQSPAVP